MSSLPTLPLPRPRKDIEMKIHKILFWCPLIALLSISCGNNRETDLPDVSQKGTTVIQADIESLLLGTETRVWPEGAYVGVFGSESGINEKYVLKRSDKGLASAEFYGPEVSGETIAAYFPWSETYTGRAEAMPAHLPAEQDYAEASAISIFQNYCPTAYSSMRDGRMKFFYPFGMLRVRVELFDCLKVQRISFTSADSPVAGKGVILPDGTLKMEGGGVNSVILDCGEGVEAVSLGEKLFLDHTYPRELSRSRACDIRGRGGSRGLHPQGPVRTQDRRCWL